MIVITKVQVGWFILISLAVFFVAQSIRPPRSK